MILLSQTRSCSPTALFIYRPPLSCGSIGIRTILVIAIFVSLGLFFCLILPADQVLLRLLRYIATTKLIGTNPDNGSISVGKDLLFYSIRNLQFIADLVAIMTINNNVIPNNDVLAAAFHHQIRPARFVICDGDIVERKNLDRQNFVPADLGENKARILAERYSTVLSMETEYVPNFIETLPELMALIAPNLWETDGFRNRYAAEMVILLGCVDNNRTRQLCHEAFRQSEDLVYIDSGNGSYTGQVVCGVRRNGHTMRKPIGSVHPEMLRITDKFPSELSCAEAAQADPQSIVANVTAATAVLTMVYNILTHGENIALQTDFSTRTIRMQTVLEKQPRRKAA